MPTSPAPGPTEPLSQQQRKDPTALALQIHPTCPASCVLRHRQVATSCKSLHDEHAHARAKILNTFKLIQFIWIDVLSRTQEHRIALRSYDSKRELMVVSPCYLFNMFAQAKKWLQAISQTQRLAPQRAKASGINSRPKMSQASSIVGYVGLRRDFPTGQSTAQLTGAVSSKSQESQLLLFASFYCECQWVLDFRARSCKQTWTYSASFTPWEETVDLHMFTYVSNR